MIRATWSLAKLAGFLVAEGMVDDISHEGLRVLLRQEGVSAYLRTQVGGDSGIHSDYRKLTKLVVIRRQALSTG